MAGGPCGMEHMHIIRFLGRREYGLGATALAFIVLQVYLIFSIGCLKTSIVFVLNSASSSKNNTPLCAKDISPGFGTLPPPDNACGDTV